MTTITGFTSTRMLGIENNTVVSGTISGDDLILTKHDGSTVNAGDVRGPQGIQGPIGEVSQADLDAAVALVNADITENADEIAAGRVPAGMVSMIMVPQVPSGWLALEGQGVTSADTLYPDLWGVAPNSWKTGTTLVLPDMRGRMAVGMDSSHPLFDTLEQTGGVTSVTLAKSNVPKHTHKMDHDHPAVTSEGDEHQHFQHVNTTRFNTPGSIAGDVTGSGGGLSGGTPQLLTEPDTHDHVVDLPEFEGNTEDGTANGLGTVPINTVSPYFVIRFVIKT